MQNPISIEVIAAKILESHFAISNWGGKRKPPRVFTQEGVAMLSSVLNAKERL